MIGGWGLGGNPMTSTVTYVVLGSSKRQYHQKG
jgi:hypothetical protein